MVLLNSNPATIMTDPDTADRTYIGPMTPELVEQILAKVSQGTVGGAGATWLVGGASGEPAAAQHLRQSICQGAWPSMQLWLLGTGTRRHKLGACGWVALGWHQPQPRPLPGPCSGAFSACWP